MPYGVPMVIALGIGGPMACEERNPNTVNVDGTPIFCARLPKKWNRE